MSNKDVITEDYQLLFGDCLERMKEIPDGSIDLILTDPPYGTTQNKWDSVIPFEQMWEQLKRIIKPNGAIVLFGSEPFSSLLRISNLGMFKYDWVRNKTYGTNFQFANRQPMKAHETVSVFYDKQSKYYPIKTKRDKVIDTTGWKQDKRNGNHKNFNSKEVIRKVYDEKFPISVLEYNPSIGECNNTKKLHPTQKPVALLEYLIKTYTNENEVVLDFTAGSFSTGVACVNTGRSFIGIEMDENYFNIGVSRVLSTKKPDNNLVIG